MCEVCAIFGIGDHWTDAAATSNPAYPAHDIQRFRAARQRRLNLINELIGQFGVTCADWDGESIVLTDEKGRMVVVPDLAQLWPNLEKIMGVRLDPLAPEVLP
ncbi:MAG: hypothetical protein O7C66_00420 [Alphaproteobacteria bacterium]|nr:hypothetical protein [Alphaproteobacteria bacterium]